MGVDKKLGWGKTGRGGKVVSVGGGGDGEDN